VRIAQPFALGEFLVTRKQYAAFAAETGHQGSGCVTLPLDGTASKFGPALSWRDPGFTQAGDHPVVCVSWDDAIAYTSWLSKKNGRNYRLPSEAEWEYAARAGSTAGRYFGDASICEFANVRDQSKKLLYSSGQFVECGGVFSNTSPVGSFPPNGFGLYDVLGNAWEWVEDCWGSSYVGAPVDGAAREKTFCGTLVRRGGSWNSDHRNVYNVGSRARSAAYWRAEIYGFRVASDYPEPASTPSEAPMIAQAASPATSSPGAPQSSDWDGTWAGSWGGQIAALDGQIAAKIIVSGGDVFEYESSGNPQQGLGHTIISGNTLTFSTQRGSVITLTKQAPFIAEAHYHSPFGDADGLLMRSSPGAPQSSDWDGSWIGAWRGGIEALAKIIPKRRQRFGVRYQRISSAGSLGRKHFRKHFYCKHTNRIRDYVNETRPHYCCRALPWPIWRGRWGVCAAIARIKIRKLPARLIARQPMVCLYVNEEQGG